MKTITFATNFNNKLDCPFFLHIAIAPMDAIHERVLQASQFQIVTADGSHPPVIVKLLDLARLPLRRLTNALTWQSHGMTAEYFINWLIDKWGGVELQSEVAVYFYQRV